jgi:hypothetical protein
MKIGLWVIGALSALVAVFYAFNAYIQLQERGFTEAIDIPIVVIAGIIAIAAFWQARRIA